MATETRIDDLKPYVRKAILRGDFLLSINEFSDVWIYLHRMNVEEARGLIRDTLVGFWDKYLAKNEGDYILLALEHVEEYSEDEIPTAVIAEEAVGQLDTPQLQFGKILIDPENFELFLEKVPRDRIGMLFVALSIHLDLLRRTIEQLRELGCSVQGVIVILEREKVSGPEVRNKLQVELVPFMVYEEQGNNLYAITEIIEEPYIHYHRYFS